MDYGYEDLLVRCDCHHLDHIAEFTYFPPDNNDPFGNLYLTTHLNTWRGFWHRLWLGVRYILGVKEKCGHWDELCISQESAAEIVALVSKHVKTETRGEREGA